MVLSEYASLDRVRIQCKNGQILRLFLYSHPCNMTLHLFPSKHEVHFSTFTYGLNMVWQKQSGASLKASYSKDLAHFYSSTWDPYHFCHVNKYGLIWWRMRGHMKSRCAIWAEVPLHQHYPIWKDCWCRSMSPAKTRSLASLVQPQQLNCRIMS